MLLLARCADKFEPTATYDNDGNCIEFLAKPDPFYAERIDDLVTVYYSQETGEVMESLIKGVAKFCRDVLKKIPGFKIEILDGPVRLQLIFLARMWSAAFEPEGMATLTCQKLIEVSRETTVEGELCLV